MGTLFIPAMYGSLFASNSEAAFSNYRMWESLGFIIAFAYSNFICTRDKTIVLLVMLFIGNILYFYVEFHNRQNKTVELNQEESEKAAAKGLDNPTYANELPPKPENTYM